jgi:hypothetical protein
VTAAGDFYTDDLMMGLREASLCGHWKDELAALEKGLAALERQRRDLNSTAESKPAPRYQPVAGTGDGTPVVVHQPATSATVGTPLTITAEVSHASGVKWVRLRYRDVNQHQDYQTLPMLPTGVKNQYRAMIPAGNIVPTWDLMYFIEAMAKNGNGRIYPDLNNQMPYIVVELQR